MALETLLARQAARAQKIEDQEKAARAMLAALTRLVELQDAGEDIEPAGKLYDDMRAAIAQAEAAGIKAEG